MAEDGVASEAENGTGRSRVAVAVGIAGGVVLVAVAAAWIERAPIVEHFVDDALVSRRVAARYRIAAIGPFAQRLETVSIGDPAAPDLVARVVEVRVGYGAAGPHVAGIRAEGVRLAARVRDGRLSLGALDRLIPASSGGGPVALPDIDVRLHDAVARIATPAGTIDAAVEGAGSLARDFAGTVTARAPRLTAAGCVVAAPAATLRVRVASRRPRIVGPVALAGVACGNGLRLAAGHADLDLAFAPALDRWAGTVTPAGLAGGVPGARFGALGGQVAIAGGSGRVGGSTRLTAAGMTLRGARAAGIGVAGRWRYAAASGLVFAGDVTADHVAADARLRRRIAAGGAAAAATPLAPLGRKAARAAAAALAGMGVDARVAMTAGGPAGTAIKVRSMNVDAASGATVRVAEGAGFGWSVADGGWRADGRVAIAGGGMPTLAATIRQPHAGAPLSGTVRLAPYAAGGARLALTPVTIAAERGGTRFATVATVDGPIGTAGRIEGLRVPVAGRIAGGGVAIGRGCVPVAFRRLAIGGTVLDPARFVACGAGGGPIVASGPGGVRAGATVAGVRLAGRTGTTPLTAAAGTVRVDPGGFAAGDLAVRLGRDDAVTRLDVARLDGRFAGGVGGGFAGAGGQIGRVPLLLSGADGRWRLAGGALALDGGMTVSDAAPVPRFRPMRGDGVTLTLRDGRIAAAGTLAEPRTGARVADVRLGHDLATGRGDATLAVPGIVFDRHLQPEMLTPVTLGVVANVQGRVAGDGRIDWSADGVTSTGSFRTDRLDLAAAFGPVTGIAGTIRFSDLLGLETLPHQEATVAEINPGVAVTGGVVHYQLLAGQRVRVEDARWPFAGGTLTLDPSTLAFDAQSRRRLTFRLRGLDAAAFVQQLAFPNLAATGTFDGVMPMVFDQNGGRIEGGEIVARPPGGTIAYLGELSRERVGMMGRLTFDALKAIRYTSLSIGLDGRLDGEIVSRVRFVGVRQATAESGIVARMIRNLPFRFNIAIRAPFRSLVGTARSYADPSLLLHAPDAAAGDAPPTAEQPPAIQPPESEPVR